MNKLVPISADIWLKEREKKSRMGELYKSVFFSGVLFFLPTLTPPTTAGLHHIKSLDNNAP